MRRLQKALVANGLEMGPLEQERTIAILTKYQTFTDVSDDELHYHCKQLRSVSHSSIVPLSVLERAIVPRAYQSTAISACVLRGDWEMAIKLALVRKDGGSRAAEQVASELWETIRKLLVVRSTSSLGKSADAEQKRRSFGIASDAEVQWLVHITASIDRKKLGYMLLSAVGVVLELFECLSLFPDRKAEVLVDKLVKLSHLFTNKIRIPRVSEKNLWDSVGIIQRYEQNRAALQAEAGQKQQLGTSGSEHEDVSVACKILAEYQGIVDTSALEYIRSLQ
ncbi:hypothetical protein FVE85_8315 [Porphyridium purpureum]|uniref:Uncharacterized protein n=1 Tax=Porphyridium purpureum TaxID=35688 RepID=A0A5J4YME5_PORPP|nr:hypothetical protein FVE85_8315 [Porphyridium purpureum]|eukprot:POR3550..scf244_11